MCCHFLLQGIFSTQRLNWSLLHQQGGYHRTTREALVCIYIRHANVIRTCQVAHWQRDARDIVLIPGSGRSPGGHGNPLQYSCLENSMVRGTWWITVHGVTNSRTQLSEHSRTKCYLETICVDKHFPLLESLEGFAYQYSGVFKRDLLLGHFISHQKRSPASCLR